MNAEAWWKENALRVGYWTIVIVLGIWAVIERRPAELTATRPLPLNHILAPGDLQTSQIAALNGRYLRVAVPANMPVPPGITADAPGPPALSSGIALIVNLDRKTCDSLHLHVGDTVRILAHGKILGKPGAVQAIVCDELRCSVVIAAAQQADFDPKLLDGAELARDPPGGN